MKKDIRKDLNQFQDAVRDWQGRAARRIKHVEVNQGIMCGVIQEIEASQSECSDSVAKANGDIQSIKSAHNKMIAAIAGIQGELNKLKVDCSQHQRNWNDFNLIIFNVKSPPTPNNATNGREDTLSVVAKLIHTNNLLPNNNIDDIKG